MNDIPFSEHSLAGVSVQKTAREIETPQVAVESASADEVDLFHQELEERELGNIIEKEASSVSSPVRFGMEDGVESSGTSFKLDVPEIEGMKDFSDALRVYDAMADSPARHALEEKMEGFRRSLINRGFMDPVVKFSIEEKQEKLARLDALAMDWKEHPEARKKAVEAYGEEWAKAFEMVPEERRDLVRGDMLLNELYSRPGDKEGDARMRLFSSLGQDELNGIRDDADIWRRFARERSAVWEEQERKKAAMEKFSQDLSIFLEDYVRGKKVYLSPEQAKMIGEMGVSWGSIKRARKGYEAVAAYLGGKRLFDDDVITKLAVCVGDDETARQMLLNMLYNESRKQARDKFNQVKFGWDESSSGLLEVFGIRSKRGFERGWRDLVHLGEAEAASNVAARLPDKIAAGLSMEEARREIEEDRAFLDVKRRWEKDLVETMEEAENDYLNGPDRNILQHVASNLGGVVGDTSTFLVPYGGILKTASLGRMAGVARLGGAAAKFGIAGGASRQRRREEGISLGLDALEAEQRAGLFGTADFLEEMIAFGGLGRTVPGFGRLTKWAGKGKPATWRARFAASPKAQLAAHTLMGVAEEGFFEPTAGFIMRSAEGLFLNDERGKATFSGYIQEMQAMMEPEQLAALALFSGGMSSLHYGRLKRDSARFRDMLAAYRASGGTEAGLLDAMKQPDMKGVMEKAVSHLHDAWMEDPQGAMERAGAAAGERLSGERIESLRELDAWRAAEAEGLAPRVEPAEQEGMFRVYAPARDTEVLREEGSVSGQEQEEGHAVYTLMDGEQMTAYLQAFVDADMERTIVRTQNMLAGDVMVSQGLAQRRFDEAEVITRTVVNEKTGKEEVVIAPETLGQMKARADLAMAAIRAMEAEGVSYEEAAASTDASLSEHIPLGTLVETWNEAQRRIETEKARNPEFKAPGMDDPFSNAYVTRVRRGDTFRRVLRYARGNATVEDLMEETMEQAVISWKEEQSLGWGEFGAMLQEAQRAMNELFPEARGEEMQFIHLDAGKPVTGHDAVEAFSRIGRSRWLADAVQNTALPAWLRKLLQHLVKFLGYFKARVELGEMVRQAEEQGVFSMPVRQALAVMLDAGNALYRDQQGDLIALTMEKTRTQAELDAMFGAGVTTEAQTMEDELAESRQEDEARRKEAEEEALAPENSPEAQEARREREQDKVEALGEPDESGVFNGAFIEVQEGVRQGFVSKDRLTLCPDVPQFKQGADAQTGVVNPIVGVWQRNAAPISVWRRKDGALQVISGRHRFNACTDEDINCTVYDEAAGFDLDWAITHDVENNIRDGQATLFEIARYVSRKGLTKEEAVERGIFRKGQSRRGVELGLYGCSDLLDALGNELVSPDDAWRVAMAFRNQTEVQRAGLRALMEGKSWQAAYAVMQVAANMDRIRGMAEAAGMTFETDLFGNSHADEYFSRLAQYAAARVSELTKEISSISGSSRRPETARKYGVDVRDAAALEAVVKELKEQRARWQNFGLHEDLIKEANDAVMVELGMKTQEQVDAENGLLPLETTDQEADAADTGMLLLSQDVSRMLDGARKREGVSAEGERPAATFSMVSIPAGDVITTAAEMRARLKPLQGKVFVNKNTGIEAVIEARVSSKTVGKAGASQMSVANLKRFGISVEDARTIHHTAATRIHELFENAEDGFFEESYKDNPGRAGAYHFFNTVDIEGMGRFDVNVTAIKPEDVNQNNILYSLELTIEKPQKENRSSHTLDRGDTNSNSGVSEHNLSSYLSFVKKEKAAIKKKAKADGTFMKAPNGAETNLTEDQWLSVRTEAFKRWFGDWEHDPENASKVVDENGEPMVVYHGSSSKEPFTIFGAKRSQSQGSYLNKDQQAFFFAKKDVASLYQAPGAELMACFLNLRNPRVADVEADINEILFDYEDRDEAIEYGYPLDRWEGKGEESFEASDSATAYFDDHAQEFYEEAKGEGNDGIVVYGADGSITAIAFEPTQIKSATDNRGTYDPENPDITFSIISAQEQGLFWDGHFEAGNAVITEPGVTFSIAALHASPHSFRKFSTDFMGKGEGAQAYGWGLYFATNPEVNRDYLNQFSQDKATWRFRDVETAAIEEMQRALVDRLLPKDTLPEVKEDASDMIWTVLGDLSDARGDEGKIDAIKKELREDIQHSMEYGRTYPQTLEKMVQLNGVYRSLIALLDEIEVRPGSTSNYRVELNVDDSELLDWDYVDATILELLKDSPVEEVRYALERAERRADYRGENVSGKDVYLELFDAFWDGEDGTRQEAQKAASVSLLSSDIKGIRYADALSRWLAKDKRTYNYVIFNGKDIKITAFADESTGGEWADYVDPQATFSVVPDSESLSEVSAAWKQQLDDYAAGNLKNNRRDLRVGPTPAVLRMLGADAHDLVITPAVLDKVTKDKHSVPLSELERLPEALHKPIAVFESVTQGDSIVVLTELKEGNDPVVVAVHLNASGGFVQVNRIASVYGKNNSRALLNMPLLYLDNKKASSLMGTSRLQLPTVIPSRSRTRKKVMTPKDLFKWKEQNSLPAATFSIIGERAESFLEYHNNGLSYTDPADGKRKAIIDSRGVRLRKEHVSVSEGGHVNVSLAAALDFPELFRAYPELRKLRVDFYRDSKSGVGGFTDPNDHYIAVNVARGAENAGPGMVLDTILHEVQHVIQGHEGFATGAGSMGKEAALAYLRRSMGQLRGRDDAWAKEALPRLERMEQELEEGTLQPAFVYVFSHGEQEARLAGKFSENSEGVVMSGLNGFRLLEAPQFSIPLTGDISELGGITFGAGRFGRMADRVLAPNGDWLYDSMVFKMRAAAQRAVNKLRLHEAGDRERGLELLAEAQELIGTVERFLPHSYGFGLEPYKIWLNVFSLLYGNSGKKSPDEAVFSALEAIPMKKWPEIMMGSISRNFIEWAESRPELEDVVVEARREIDERQADYELDSSPGADNSAALAARKGVAQEVWGRVFVEHGGEFLEGYGEQKVYRLVERFMERVVEQIDRFRKDRTLGRVRRVVASVAPRTNPKGRPMRGKMSAEAYRRMERCVRLMEMTGSQYDEFFQKNFPEDAEEGKRWEDLAPDALVRVTLPDAEGRQEEVAVTQREFEVYACYEQMSVETAENAARALGELIATSRQAWENAAEKKKMEVAAMVAPVLRVTGFVDDQAMKLHRQRARLRALPKGPMSLLGYLANFTQYMQALSSVKPFAGVARQFEARAARFAVLEQNGSKEALRAMHEAVDGVVGSTDKYDVAEWLRANRMSQDTGIAVMEREPDWRKRANALYRERFLHLLRRKVKTHGLEAVQLYLNFFKLSEDLRREVNSLFGHRGKELTAKEVQKAMEHKERVFTQKEWERYQDQKVFVRERMEMLRSGTKFAKEGYQPKSYRLDGLSRMEAAYLVLLGEQADYTETLAERGFDADVMEQLREFAGDEVMRVAYALRKKLNERSGQVQEMTERRYGTPFPLVENYFRAFFDVGMEAIDKSVMDAAAYGEAATGGKYGIIHARRRHHAHLDLGIDVATAFMAAMKEQDLYLYGSEISRDLRALLNFKSDDGEAGRSLEVLLGRDAVDKLMVWCDSFDRGMAGNVRGFMELGRLVNRVSSVAAVTVLPGRVGSWLKQCTALINAAYSSDEIDPHQWAGSVRRWLTGRLVVSPGEMAKRDVLAGRDTTAYTVTREAASADEAGRADGGRLRRLNVAGMDALTRTDVRMNAVSSAILYDAVFRKAKRESPELSDEEADAMAMREVELSLSRKSQPLTLTQRSLAAQTRSVWNVGLLFLGGESFNTLGEVAALWRQGGARNKFKSFSMYYSHGLMLALIGAMLNFLTDDEKRRRKREWWHVFVDALMGPLAGIPIFGALAGGALRGAFSLGGYDAYLPGNADVVPFASWGNLERAFKRMKRMFDGKEKDWEDYPLAMMEVLRIAAFGTAAFNARTGAKGSKAAAVSLSAAALINLMEFMFKAIGGVRDRLEGR